MIEHFRYRPEIDGLRAIAVVAVVLFHAGMGISGGYIGVDVFFVISGFLITSLIVKDIQSKKFSLLDFWERRARRILPASIVMAISVAVAGWYLLLPTDYAIFARTLLSQATFLSNIYFWRNTGYFDGPAEEQPLLHTWSLSVEEQFYMVVPCFLFLLYTVFKRRGLSAVRWGIAVGLFASLFLSIYTTPRMPGASFYLLPTRAWELLCGSYIALIPSVWVPRRKLSREVVTTLGLCAIIVPCFLYDENTVFPGLAALPPCLGASMIILGAAPLGEVRQPYVSRVLSLPGIVFVGLISYSFYLWHWPIFAFSNYWELGDVGLTHRGLLVALAFALSILSWKFVETPFRKKRVGATRSSIFAYSGFGSFLMLLVACVLLASNGVPTRYPEVVNKIDSVKSQNAWDHLITEALTLEMANSGELPLLGDDRTGEVRLLVWGDSHARSILPAVASIATDRGVAIASAWNSSTPPLLDYIPCGVNSRGRQTPAISNAVVEYIKVNRIQTVLLVAQWSGYLTNEFTQGKDDSANDALIQTIRALKALNVTVWVMEEVPWHHVDVPDALAHREIWGTDIFDYCGSVESHSAMVTDFESTRARLEAAGARTLSVSEFFYDPNSESYKMGEGDVVYYFDRNHLTPEGAAQLLPVFSKIFR